MATQTPSKPSKAAKPKKQTETEEQEQPKQQEEPANEDKTQVEETEAAAKEVEDDLDALESKADPKRWVIGKPPEEGGKEEEYAIYVQRRLGYMARMRFFSLVGNTVSEAIKAGGSVDIGFSDVFGPGGGSIRNRAAALGEQDFQDAGSFMALAMKLIAYTPDFLLECHCLWLDVPPGERQWAKAVMDQDWQPKEGKWGMTEDQGLEMVEIFIDQNYEEIRRFFVEKLPKLVERIQAKEQVRKSGSDQSKQ